MPTTGTVSQYAKEIPEEIKSVIKGLDDDIRVAIIVLLLKKNKLLFTDIKNELRIRSNSSLSHHLTILQDGGLVENHVELKKDKRVSYYRATDMAREILKSLFDVILLPSGKSVDTPMITVATTPTPFVGEDLFHERVMDIWKLTRVIAMEGTTIGTPTSSPTYFQVEKKIPQKHALIHKHQKRSGASI